MGKFRRWDEGCFVKDKKEGLAKHRTEGIMGRRAGMNLRGNTFTID